jgi:transposase
MYLEVRELKKRIAAVVVSATTVLTETPGLGPITAAKIIGEIGDIRRGHSKAALAMASGVAPIPAPSGQTRRHGLNHGDNRQLNRAQHNIALIQVRIDPRARA